MSSATRTGDSDDFDLLELFQSVWRGRWVIFFVMLLFVGTGITYALMAKEWFRAEVVLTQAERSATSGMGQLGGLASLAGINLGGNTTPESMMILRSRDLVREFIEARNLLPVLFLDQWDQKRQSWKDPASPHNPDIRDGVDFFVSRVRGITEDKRTGEIHLAIYWTDASVAAVWANELVRTANARLRTQALDEAQKNIAFLQAEIAETNMPVLQQAISKALESELQKLMLAKKGEEYAFRVVDRAVAPKTRDSPKRKLIALLSAAFGLICGIAIVLVRDSWRVANA
jgi:uncharacterized protein involved in exopolysaccharide biosynthesis